MRKLAAGQVCYNNVNELPASCSGTITLDDKGGCRKLKCESGSGSITVLACDKDNSFEMYRQEETDSSIDVCFADTCLDNWGYRKGHEYPVCTES